MQTHGISYGSSPTLLSNANAAYREDLFRNNQINLSQFAYLHQDAPVNNSYKSNSTNMTSNAIQENQAAMEQSMYRRISHSQGQFINDQLLKADAFANNPLNRNPKALDPQTEMNNMRRISANGLDNYDLPQTPYNSLYNASQELGELQRPRSITSTNIKSVQTFPHSEQMQGMNLSARNSFKAIPDQSSTKGFEERLHEKRPNNF